MSACCGHEGRPREANLLPYKSSAIDDNIYNDDRLNMILLDLVEYVGGDLQVSDHGQ